MYCSIVERTPLVRDLGVKLSNYCSWTTHIQHIAGGAKKMASWVLSVFRDRSQLVMLTLFKTMVRSKLEYCSPVWDASTISDIQAIENVQRYFTKRISSCKDLDYWARLRKLKLMSLQRRRERYKIIHVWEILHDEAPNNIVMTFYEHKRLGTKVQIPQLNNQAQRSLSTHYDNSFGVKAGQLWNLLPKAANEKDTLPCFKVELDAFLRSFPDTPPVSGYIATNKNSLLDWNRERGGHTLDAVVPM